MDQFMKDVFSKKGFSGMLTRCLLFSFTGVATLCGLAMIVYALGTMNLLIGICGTVSTIIWLAWFMALCYYADEEVWNK